MEFDKNKVYTSLNADELKVGSRVILADSLESLKYNVTYGHSIVPLVEVRGEGYSTRFFDGKNGWCLAYLVEEPGKLHWYDLKVGDIIKRPFEDGNRFAMVTMIDTYANTTKHIGLTSGWLDDTEIEDWEVVE